jgi:hypothetical protein
MISSRLNLEDKKYELVVDNDDHCRFFKEMNTYIPKLLYYLWAKPKTVSKILYLSDKLLVKDHLAPLIVNNFYENIISSNYIEDNLMYVITLLLKNEISEINDEKDSEKFLEETACGYVLEQLRAKNDIKYYFKNIISDILKKMEAENSGGDINLNVKQIQEKYQKTKEELDKLYKKTGKKKKIIDEEFYRKILISNIFSYQEEDNESGFLIPKDNIDPKLFNSKYIPDLTKSELETKKNNTSENEQKMIDYYDFNIKNCEKDDSYGNQKLLQNIFDSPISKEVLASYQIEFSKIINTINKLIENLLQDLYLLPYSVKCVCKIIFLLLNKKFGNIGEAQRNAFIAKFFFNKLFAPIFENPGLGASIDEIIISETTKHNATIINLVLKKLVSGRLFRTDIDSDSDYTPLNWFFLDKMPEVFKFFESITKVTLPNFIEKLINDELPKDFELDYFEENKDEVIFHRSICFTLYDLDALLISMDKCKSIIFENEKEEELKPLRLTFEKLVGENCSKIMKKLKDKKEYEKIMVPDGKNKKNKQELKETEGREILKYFLLTDLITNKKYTRLFEIEQEKANYSIKELKKTETPEEITKNNIIKVKNFFCNLLYNFHTLVKTDFDEGTLSNTNSILKEIKKYIKSSDFVIDGSIPSEWYVSSLLEYLKKLPEELSKDDFKELYNEMEKDISSSIKELDFEALSICLGKAKFAKRIKVNYETTYKHILNIDLNVKVQKIIEKDFIPVEIHYKYTKKEKEFYIEEKPNIKEKNSLDILEEGREKKNICRTIKLFTKKFPDLVKTQISYDKTLTEMDEEMKLNENLQKYFNIIKKKIEKEQKNADENELLEINNKIYDYVMEKIYEKIFPVEPDPEDNLIFRKCFLLSWVEPKHFIGNKKNYVFDSFLPDVIEFFGKLDKEKSPRIKFIYMKKIFVAINDVLRFNGKEGEAGVDDQMPILNYSFIKAKPQHISSNYKFMNIFIGKNRNRSEGSQLTQISGICEHVLNLTYDQLNGVTKEEFDEKCKNAYFG